MHGRHQCDKPNRVASAGWRVQVYNRQEIVDQARWASPRFPHAVDLPSTTRGTLCRAAVWEVHVLGFQQVIRTSWHGRRDCCTPVAETVGATRYPECSASDMHCHKQHEPGLLPCSYSFGSWLRQRPANERNHEMTGQGQLSASCAIRHHVLSGLKCQSFGGIGKAFPGTGEAVSRSQVWMDDPHGMQSGLRAASAVFGQGLTGFGR